MDDLYRELQHVTHGRLAQIWRAYKAGAPLEGESQRLAEAMAAHPEWAPYWEIADDAGDAEILTPEGVNPFAAVAVEAAVEGIISRGGDTIARRVYQRLRREGLSHRDTRTEIARVLLGVYWEIGTGRIQAEAMLERFHAALRRLRADETARDFSGGDEGEGRRDTRP